MNKSYNMNIFVNGEKVTLELSTPVKNLFDFCSMLQEQLHKGNIPINAEIHSIVPIECEIKNL